MLDALEADLPELIAWRRDLHAHPELSYEEHRTSAFVASLLEGWGFEVARGLAGTGVVGRLRRGTSTRSIGLRADMDALPLQEANRFGHASRYAGRMHACGHDGHTTMLLGAARQLARGCRFDGTVNLIFQPAEERGAGALRMIEAGLFERYPCDAVFALHNWPGLPAGRFGLRSGAMMAGTSGFEITIHGRGAHAAMPHQGVDAAMVACHVAVALQTVVSRERDPLDAVVLSITQVHAGDTMNVIAPCAVLKGTVRAFEDSALDRLEQGLRRVVAGTAAAFDAAADVDFRRNYPPLVNDAGQAALAAQCMRDVVGSDAVDTHVTPSMAAEDFAYMLQARPGCYAFLGSGAGTHRLPDHGPGGCGLHDTSYDFNDALLPLGARYFVRLVERHLSLSTP